MAPKRKGKRSNELSSENNEEKKTKLKDSAAQVTPFRIRSDIQESVTMKDMNEAWRRKNGTHDVVLLDGDVTVNTDPFLSCVVKNFVGEKGSDNLLDLISDLDDLELQDKNNDLYKFRQSKDLFHSDIPSIAALKDFLVEEVKPWLQQMTGIEDLNDTVDMFCAKYAHTDHLLCHDDKLEGRRIAYILYLVPDDWCAEDGGSLDLFTSENGKPLKIARSILPAKNSFAFFEVSPTSYHQVAEVLSESKVRLSVTGWFHGPAVKREIYTDPKPVAPRDITEQEFYWWINPIYLDPLTQAEIKAKFEESSEISLPDFLIAEKYQEVCTALTWIKEEWYRVGPANKRCYDVLPMPEKALLKPASLDLVRSCVNFLASDAFCLVLSNMTGLRLHPLAEKDGSEVGNEPCEIGDDSNVKIDTDIADDSSVKIDGDAIEDDIPPADDVTEEKMDEGCDSSLTEEKISADLDKKPDNYSSKMEQNGVAERTKESAMDDESNIEDDWSNASTFGESESKFSVQTESSMMKSTPQRCKRVEIRVDGKPISDDASKSVSASLTHSTTAPSTGDDNWSIAATVGESADPLALIRHEVRRWRRGCYSLLFDDDTDDNEALDDRKVASLDARLFFNCPNEWDLEWGGFSSYLAKNEDEELLTAPPVPNTLSLVYRDAETFGFVKFLNSKFPQKEFHDISLSYVEQSPDD